jgi:hypothetical protein
MGIIRARGFGGKQQDEIDQALGSSIYATPHYDTGLRDALLTKHATTLIPVTRYYFRLEPRVIVDFEPQPGERWWAEEKRRYFTERGIVYVPVALKERITVEEFRARVASETATMRETLRTQDVRPGEVVDPTILTAARAEAARRCDEQVRAGALKPGPGYDRAVVATTRALIVELTEQDANGRLGYDLSRREFTQPVG